MPNKELLRQLELEKKRRGINRSVGDSTSEAAAFSTGDRDRDSRYAWELELEAYRAQKKRNRWLAAGALCGVLSLVLELVMHWQSLVGMAVSLMQLGK